MRRKLLPPDTRPKWDDPDLGTFVASEELQECALLLAIYDNQPKELRDKIKDKNFCISVDGFNRYIIHLGDGV